MFIYASLPVTNRDFRSNIFKVFSTESFEWYHCNLTILNQYNPAIIPELANTSYLEDGGREKEDSTLFLTIVVYFETFPRLF